MHVSINQLRNDQFTRSKSTKDQKTFNFNNLKYKSFYKHPNHDANHVQTTNLCSFKSSRDNPFFSGIEAMPDIRPRKKSIPLVSELVLKVSVFLNI